MAVPQGLNRAELARVNVARAESRAIVDGFSARIKTLARQAPATGTLDATQQALVNQILLQIDSLLAQAIAGTLTDTSLLQLLTDIASTLIVPTTTTTYVYFETLFIFTTITLKNFRKIYLREKERFFFLDNRFQIFVFGKVCCVIGK
jgi:hypothetical protein